MPLKSIRDRVFLSACVERDQLVFLQQLAQVEGTSVSALVRNLIGNLEQLVAATEAQGGAQERADALDFRDEHMRQTAAYFAEEVKP